MEIMKLIPTGKDYLWGGTRLREEYGKKIDLTPLAETWECSVHPDGPSYVANGIYKGQTLAEVLAARPEYLGTKVENGELPVLVKFIDAKKDLSVQVHPDDAYAREHEGDNGKTEMWYVIDADEGASLIYGFQHEVTEEILRKAVETGTLGKHLQKVPVHKGDTYFVPAGTVHGIGKGILVAEIQESSNVTYRVYDYDRVDKNGKKRELHFDKAVQVMNMKVAPDVSQKPRIVKYYSGCSRELLCRCKYFETERIQVTKGFAFSVMDTSFQVLMCLNGYGEVQTMDAEQKPMRFSKGETMFLSAGLGRCLVVGDALLESKFFSANTGSVIVVGKHISLGHDVMMGRNIVVYDSDFHSIPGEDGKPINFSKDVIIEDHVWLTNNVTVLKGVTIGKDSLISAMTLIRKDVPEKSLVAGIPGKVLKDDACWSREYIHEYEKQLWK